MAQDPAWGLAVPVGARQLGTGAVLPASKAYTETFMGHGREGSAHLRKQGIGYGAALSGEDGQHGGRGAAGEGAGRLHGGDLLLGGKAALDARPHLCVRLAALVPDRLLERAPLPLLAIPAHRTLFRAPSIRSKVCLITSATFHTLGLLSTKRSASLFKAGEFHQPLSRC